MNPSAKPERSERGFPWLEAASPMLLLAGAVGSLGLMLYAGHDAPRFLVVLFAGWVLSPFLAVQWANRTSKRWPLRTRAPLHVMTLVLALGSLAVYGADALRPPRPQAAFVYVVVPAVSLLLVAIAAGAAALISGRKATGDDRS
jgi:hypothetical protein